MLDKQHLVTRLGDIAKEMQDNRALFSQHVDFMEQLNMKYHNLCGAKVECETLLKKADEVPPNPPENTQNPVEGC